MAETSRFGLSGDTGDMDFKIQPLTPKPAPKPACKRQQPDAEPAPVGAPDDAPVKSLLDVIPVELEVHAFTAGTVVEIIRPAVPHVDHLNMVVEMLRQAENEAANSGKSAMSQRQIVNTLNLIYQMSAGIGEAMQVAAGLEWSVALHSMCLRHLIDNPSVKEARRTEAMRARMLQSMTNFLEEDSSNEQ